MQASTQHTIGLAYTETWSPLVRLYKFIGLHYIMHTPGINRNVKILPFVFVQPLFWFFFLKKMG